MKTSRWVTRQFFDVNDVFDRVLERDDVIAALHVYLLDHCRERSSICRFLPNLSLEISPF